MARTVDTARDPHSYSRPHEVAVEHLDLRLDLDFERQVMRGTAHFKLDRRADSDQVVLDIIGLEIHSVTRGAGEGSAEPASYQIGESRPVLGSPLSIELTEDSDWVEVEYSTSPEAEALQWLTPEQTTDKKAPFLLTQSQPALARTWIPCQDTPSVRMTYTAEVTVPQGLMALMSAENPVTVAEDGRYRFKMLQPIPSYLIALAAGVLEFRELGSRSGVYAEPSVVEKAAWEFADTEQMIDAAERLYGPYLWERYDMIVLPSSFPYGGMENPRLTFLTPTILAGDRSLVSLVAHELAHSWSGNLVTNANWNDFWLNEGVTSYIEQRIMEELFGRDVEAMLAALALDGLVKKVDELGRDHLDTRLQLDLEGRDPDSKVSEIVYDKGQFLLRALEQAVGRAEWDRFLRGYFKAFAFQSVTTGQFMAYLEEHLGSTSAEALREVNAQQWVHGTGLPENCPRIESEDLTQVEKSRRAVLATRKVDDLNPEGWMTQHWLIFLGGLSGEIDPPLMEALDARFDLSESGNSEITALWSQLAISSWYEPAFPRLERFLEEQGRRKFLKPLYEELVKTPEGREFAARVYRVARPRYHPISQRTIDEIMNWGEMEASKR
ncbi:MAG: M1 family metallopeptidase [Acidobacteriota bacterium]|nr:MAG: M1 family metallopeptidase [Acidobacteriota bacterium]